MQDLFRFSALALTLVLVGCSSTPTGSSRTGPQARADEATAKEVKKALAVAPIFKYPDVGVTAYVGTVQLTGLVETPEQRERAAQIAAGVTGVSRVINGIMIRPMSVGGAAIQDPLSESGHVTFDPDQKVPEKLKMQTPEATESKSGKPAKDGN